MKILFASANPYLPQVVGGIEVSTSDLGTELELLGHEVAVVSGLISGDMTWLRNYFGRLHGNPYPQSEHRGLLVFRCWDVRKALGEILASWKPDLVVVQGSSMESYHLASAARLLNFETVYYLHDVGIINRKIPLPDLDGVSWISNSVFTQKTLKNSLGIDSEVIRPCVVTKKYATSSTRNFVTMVNPRPEKGGDIALAIAKACPEINFLMVEGWRSKDNRVRNLREAARLLKNVSWLTPRSDMKSVYSKTKFLLVPSQVAETWGRVITEAQLTGLPSIASDIGALSESMGKAGILVPPDASIEEWVSAVRRLWTDESEYARLSGWASEMAVISNTDSKLVGKEFERKLLRTTNKRGRQQ